MSAKVRESSIWGQRQACLTVVVRGGARGRASDAGSGKSNGDDDLGGEHVDGIGLVVFCWLIRWWNGIEILCDADMLEWVVCVDE